jgi:hypothetical protein
VLRPPASVLDKLVAATIRDNEICKPIESEVVVTPNNTEILRVRYLPPGQTIDLDVLIDSPLTLGTGVAVDKWMKAYKDLLTTLGPGVYELIVHLAYDDEEMRGVTRGQPN